MFYKPYSRKEVKLDINQRNLLQYLVKWLRKRQGIKRGAEVYIMLKNQLLDEYEKLSYNEDKKAILDEIERYETKYNVSLKRPSKIEREKIKNGKTQKEV